MDRSISFLEDYSFRAFCVFRNFLRSTPFLYHAANIFRSVFILGPWANYIIRYNQNLKNNRKIIVKDGTLFIDLEVDKIVHNLINTGHSTGICLPEEYIYEITNYCKEGKSLIYQNPHQNCEIVDRIAHNEKILQVVREYFGSDPILWHSKLFWSLPDDKINPLYNYTDFHYDTPDFKSLTVFIYLTDVDESCSPHVIIENTHNDKSISKMVRRFISNDSAEKKYGDRIKVITGKKGEGFFEELTLYHRRSPMREKPRLALMIGYVLQRKFGRQLGRDAA